MYAFRLHELQEQMVGGEKASDKRLKEERVRKRNYAEKKIKCVRETLSNLDDDDGVMMKVYDDIHDELKAKTVLVKKAKKKIQALEREISDLHSEFEDDRTDYLETIRKQDQQIKLLQQILEKVQPCIRRDCNYSNIDKIKLDSSWDEDLQKWHIPELVIEKIGFPPGKYDSDPSVTYKKTQLPPPGKYDSDPSVTYKKTQLLPPGKYDSDLSVTYKNSASPLGIQPGCNLPLASARSAPTPMDSGYLQESSDEKFRQKLEQGEREDIAGSYFKPRRQEQLLNKFQREANRVFSTREPVSNFLNSNSNREAFGGFQFTRLNNNLSTSLPSNVFKQNGLSEL
ncbi:uncharacterized protein LOC143245500 [Tachypleus tridentatus]|uniref:uncharacterized protein LOC143245500 n=1 Tax=Tachypleus tridentatus TaxID=6853 RepID=UPI003FD4E64E